MKRLFLAAALACFAAVSHAEEITKPIRYTWIVTSCEAWNCAAAALVLANGDKNVIALPTGNEARPWLILKRVEEGSIYIPEDEPFACEVFDTMGAATTHFEGIDSCRSPLILNVPDGRAVVAAASSCGSVRRRAVR